MVLDASRVAGPLPPLSEFAYLFPMAVKDKGTVKPPAGDASSDNGAQFTFQWYGAAIANLSVLGVEPQSPSFLIEGCSRKTLYLAWSHSSPIEPLAEVAQVGVANILKDRLEVSSLKESLSCIALRQTRKLGNEDDSPSLHTESKGPLKAFQFPIDSGGRGVGLLSRHHVLPEALWCDGDCSVQPQRVPNVAEVRLEGVQRFASTNLVVLLKRLQELVDRHPLMLWSLERPQPALVHRYLLKALLELSPSFLFGELARLATFYTPSPLRGIVRNPPPRSTLKNSPIAAHGYPSCLGERCLR